MPACSSVWPLVCVEEKLYKVQGAGSGSTAGSRPTQGAAPWYSIKKSRAGPVTVARVSHHCSCSGLGSRSRVYVAKYRHSCKVAEARAAPERRGTSPHSSFAQLFQQTTSRLGCCTVRAGLEHRQPKPGHPAPDS